VTDDDLPTGLPAATYRTPKGRASNRLISNRPSPFSNNTSRFVTAAFLSVFSVAAWAQAAPVEVPAEATVEPAVATADVVAIQAIEARPKAVSTLGNVKAKATEAAAATLTALLPRLAASDTVPLLDRSTMVAGDLSRLLASYDLAGTGVIAQEEEGGKVQSLLKRALTLMGTPYRWGGNSPDSGFDCSGLVGYVFQTALGIELPRVSREMAAKADAELIKNREDLKQGDLVFFGLKGRVNHVGIYVGEGRFLHSPSRGKDVRVDSLTTGYWGNRFLQARRVAL
jgi:cell wall-associated NlpC family hydrolase